MFIQVIVQVETILIGFSRLREIGDQSKAKPPTQSTTNLNHINITVTSIASNLINYSCLMNNKLLTVTSKVSNLINQITRY